MMLKFREIITVNILLYVCFMTTPQASAFEIKQVKSTGGINAWLVEDLSLIHISEPTRPY